MPYSTTPVRPSQRTTPETIKPPTNRQASKASQKNVGSALSSVVKEIRRQVKLAPPRALGIAFAFSQIGSTSAGKTYNRGRGAIGNGGFGVTTPGPFKKDSDGETSTKSAPLSTGGIIAIVGIPIGVVGLLALTEMFCKCCQTKNSVAPEEINTTNEETLDDATDIEDGNNTEVKTLDSQDSPV